MSPWPRPVPGASVILACAPFLLVAALSWGTGVGGSFSWVGALAAAGLLWRSPGSSWRAVTLGLLGGGVFGALYGKYLLSHLLDGLFLGSIPGATLGAGWGSVVAQRGRRRWGLLDADGRSLWALVALSLSCGLLLLPFALGVTCRVNLGGLLVCLVEAIAVAVWVGFWERRWLQWWRRVAEGSVDGLRVVPVPEGQSTEEMASLPVVFASLPDERVDGKLIAFLRQPTGNVRAVLRQEPQGNGGYRASESPRAILRIQEPLDAAEGKLRWREGFWGSWMVLGGMLFVVGILGLMLAAVFVITVGATY